MTDKRNTPMVIIGLENDDCTCEACQAVLAGDATAIEAAYACIRGRELRAELTMLGLGDREGSDGAP